MCCRAGSAPEISGQDWVARCMVTFEEQVEAKVRKFTKCNMELVRSASTLTTRLREIDAYLEALEATPLDGLSGKELKRALNSKKHQMEQKGNSRAATTARIHAAEAKAVSRKHSEAVACAMELENRIDVHVHNCMARPPSRVDTTLQALQEMLQEKCQQLVTDAGARLHGWVNDQHAGEFAAAVARLLQAA